MLACIADSPAAARSEPEAVDRGEPQARSGGAAVAAPPGVAPHPLRPRPDAGAIERLLEAPQRFEFHQAVRLLQRWSDRTEPGRRPALRYRNPVSIAFPASEIVALDAEAHDDDDDATRIELTPAFIGLLGVNGALPLAYTERFAAHEAAGRDPAARAFLDIFQHRAVSLFHDAWRKHRLPLQFERDRRERYLPLVLSLAGLGEPALRDRLRAREGGVADDALAFYGGLLQRRAVSGEHLERVLGDYFGVAVRLESFVGRWFALDDDNQVALGRSPARLGRDTVLGPRVWQRDLRVRLAIGPLSGAQHERFLPGGPAALALRELLALVGGAGLEYEVRLCLRAADVRPATLARRGGDAGGVTRLGWTSVLLSRPPDHDHDAAAYDLHTLTAAPSAASTHLPCRRAPAP